MNALSRAAFRPALPPGAALGLFLPLLATGNAAVWLRLLPFTLPLGVLAAWLAVLGLARAAGRARGGAAPGDLAREAAGALRPLALLCAGPALFLVPVPALPFFLLAPAAGVATVRAFAFLRRSGVSPGALELAALLLPFLAMLFVLFQVNVHHDAFQYLALLVSVARDGDLNLYDEVYLQNAERFYNPFARHSARYIGVPVIEAPFLAAGHLLNKALRLAGQFHPSTGTSFPYVFMVSLASPLFGLGALVLLYLLCREFFPRETSLMATLGFWLASALPFFSMAWNGWPHPFNVFFATLFLLVWKRGLGRRATADWALLGAIGGVLCLIRPVNAMLALFPLWETVSRLRRERDVRLLSGPLLGAVLAMAIFSPQLAAWRAVSGHWWAGPYREVGDYFDFLRPSLGGILFSTSQHGLLAWSPLVAPAWAGLALLWKRDRPFAGLALVYSLLHLWLYASWSVWWTGIGFSNRFFIELTPFFTLGLAAVLEWARARLRAPRSLLAAALSLFALWNIFLIGEYRARLVPYGIPDPGRVLEKPLTFVEIVRRHLFDFPGKAGTLFVPEWSNDSFFTGRLLHALVFGHPWRALGVVALFLALGALLRPAAAMLLRPGAGAWWRRHAGAAAGLLLAGALALHVVIAWASARTVPVGDFHHFAAVDVPVGHPAEDAWFYCTWQRPAVAVDFLSYLVYGHSIRQGAPVALVTVFGADGRGYEFTLRAGVDTAEYSYLRPEYLKDMRHRLDRVEVVRESTTGAYSKHLYPAVTCLARLELPAPLEVAKIRVRYLRDVGELVVSDVFLRDF